MRKFEVGATVCQVRPTMNGVPEYQGTIIERRERPVRLLIRWNQKARMSEMPPVT